MAPLNSSGDIYHILALLILRQAAQQTLPMVQLNYDIDQMADGVPVHSQLTVGDQVKRSVDFAASLGFADYFSTEKLKFNKTGRQAVRQKELEDHFLKRSESQPIHYIDQMATYRKPS